MSSQRRTLTRDSQFYQNMLRSKVINTSDYESSIRTLTGHLNWGYSWQASFDMLSDSGRMTNLSLEEALHYDQMDAEGLGSTVQNSLWAASGNIVAYVDATAQIELPDGETEWVHFEERLPNPFNSAFAALATAYQHDDPIDVTQIDDGLNLAVHDTDIDTAFDREQNSTTRFDTLTAYIAHNSHWVEATIGDPAEDGNCVYLPIKLGDETLTFEYPHPESDDSPLWTLADDIANGDPLALTGKTVKLAFHPAVDTSSAVDIQDAWAITTPRTSAQSSSTSSGFTGFLSSLL